MGGAVGFGVVFRLLLEKLLLAGRGCVDKVLELGAEGPRWDVGGGWVVNGFGVEADLKGGMDLELILPDDAESLGLVEHGGVS